MLKVVKMFVNPYDKGGKMVAFADVLFSMRDDGDGIFKVYGCKIFKQDNGGYSLALPSRKDEKDPNKYFPVISLDKEKQEGKDFISYLNEEATKYYLSKTKEPKGDKPKPSNQNTNVQNRNSGGLTEDDLLF